MVISNIATALALFASMMPAAIPAVSQATISEHLTSTRAYSIVQSSSLQQFRPRICAFLPNLSGCEKYRAHM